jgi:hypothetical protein
MNRRIKNLIIAATLITVASFVVRAIPAFDRARMTSADNACINNLRQIDGAKTEWALEHHKTTNDVPTWADIQPYCGREFPRCPQGGIYTIGRVDEAPKCFHPGHVLE